MKVTEYCFVIGVKVCEFSSQLGRLRFWHEIGSKFSFLFLFIKLCEIRVIIGELNIILNLGSGLGITLKEKVWIFELP